jgi:hypothetical protein
MQVDAKAQPHTKRNAQTVENPDRCINGRQIAGSSGEAQRV